MLSKFLPELNLNLRPQSPPPNESSEVDSNANLFHQNNAAIVRVENLKEKISKFLILLSVLPPIFLIIILSYRFSISIRLHNANERRDSLVSELKSQDVAYKSAFLLLKKADLLKSNHMRETQLKYVASGTFDPIREDVIVEKVMLNSQTVDLTVENKEILSAGRLILSFLNEGKVKEVSIVSADYDSTEDTYSVGLTLTY